MKSRIKRQMIAAGMPILLVGIIGAGIYSDRSASEKDSSAWQAKPHHPAATVQTPQTHQTRREEALPAGKEKTSVARRTSASTFVQYFSAQKEGIIGRYAGKEFDNPADNIFTVHLSEVPQSGDKVWLSCELTGMDDFSGVAYSINDGLATGGFPASKSDGTTRRREPVNPSELKKGENRVLFSLPANADYGCRITNLSIEIERGAGASPLTTAMPDQTLRRQKTFTQGIADSLQLETAILTVDSSALLSEAKAVSLTTLRHIDLPALDMGMTNVTAQNDGYRFLPHGEHFAEGAGVAIGYDRTKIPAGYTEDDIRTFYFDLDTKHWIALERDSIDRQNRLLVSHTTHFTDMINGVIQVPESPETQGFAPTVMNDIKAADPTAKVSLIAPPTANPRGSAALSYPIEMPPARNGMAPQLDIRYNSDGGSGLLGEGWDLSVQSITVDTRWGVPRYSGEKETETYGMSGVMLLTTDAGGEPSVAHRGEKLARQTDRQFYPRTEGAFSQIIRKGDAPGNYTWVVTDRAGTKYTYGTNGGVLKGTVKYLDEAPKEVIAEWKLSRVEELHGDWMEYFYESADEPVKGSLSAKSVYLKEVRVGNSGQEAHTVVSMANRFGYKSKQTNHARYGFLTSSNKLLDRITVSFERETLRSYGFTYAPGAFHTDVLEKITVLL
ncbi:MAG: hypothetical protein LBP98_05665 [Tannerella sp.]|nr:hypothetical protein [Tannerella sp.]